MSASTTKNLPVLLVATALGAAALAAAQRDEYKVAYERYLDCLKRKPFQYHTEGRETLSKTRDPRALEILMKDYANAEKHAKAQVSIEEIVGEHARYTLTSFLAEYFGDADSSDKLNELRRKNDRDGDAWLWIKSLAMRTRYHEASDALKIAAEGKSVALRAAAIQALVEAKHDAVLEVIPKICADLPKNQGERRMLIAAMASAILANARYVEDGTFQAAARAFIGLLDDNVKLLQSTKMVIARHLAKTFDVTSLYTNPEAWLSILKSRSSSAIPQAAGHTVVVPRFFGIESWGDRLCYVIDMSDSMCKEIPPDSKPASGPVTGSQPPKRKKDPSLLDESDIPWHLVNNRFDLAREHLKISLRRLTKEKRFCVVLFGTKVETLKSCNGMTEATPGNVQRVIQELDSIKPGIPKPPNAPDGTLQGRTNLHGGLRRAFALRKQGFAETQEYVDREAADLGCDTIFLISDGVPSCDDFTAVDKDYGEGKVVSDTEYKNEAERTPMLEYQGPYVFPRFLVEDVRRMNVFRKAQIHCIGIGEADTALLRKLAEDSMGEFYLFGGKKPN